MKSKEQKKCEADFRQIRKSLITLYSEIFNHYNGYTSFLLSNHPNTLSLKESTYKEKFLKIYQEFCSYPVEMQEEGLLYYKYTIGDYLLIHWKTEQKIKLRSEMLEDISTIPLKHSSKHKI